MTPSIYSFTRSELKSFCRELGQAEFRAEQIWNWLYVRRVTDWAAMKNLSRDLREKLATHFTLLPLKTIRGEGDAGQQQARKLLLGLHDEMLIETVLIPAQARKTICISSQVGCKFHCAFCASGQDGFHRDLLVDEMVGQVLAVAAELGSVPTHAVWMGMGEPFDNYEAVFKAARIVNDPSGLAIGARRITISTCGIIPGIQRLAQEGLQVELSVSLHATDDETRSRLMPVNRVYPLADLLKACQAYSEQTRRLVTFEYTLIKGVNDSAAHARALVKLLQPLRARVNLIPLSAVAEYDGAPAPIATAMLFITLLKKAGINSTLRVSKGSGVNAACGQLRAAFKP